jgi:hypothetical protein
MVFADHLAEATAIPVVYEVAPLAMPGIVQRGYRAYPLVDHVADKVPEVL